MGFYEVLDQVVALLRRRGRVTYGALKREFHLDDACLEDLKDELVNAQHLAVDEEGTVLVWTGAPPAAEPDIGQPAEVERQLYRVLLAVRRCSSASSGSRTGPCAMCSAWMMLACTPCGTSCSSASWRARPHPPRGRRTMAISRVRGLLATPTPDEEFVTAPVPVLVGREEESGLLRRRWNQSQAGVGAGRPRQRRSRYWQVGPGEGAAGAGARARACRAWPFAARPITRPVPSIP